MTLKETGTSGRVSDYVESDRIVDARRVNCRHIVVYRLPDDDRNVLEEPRKAHDVVLRDAENKDGIRRVRESWGFFASAEEAAKKAVELAEESDAVLWDDIVTLRESVDAEEEDQ